MNRVEKALREAVADGARAREPYGGADKFRGVGHLPGDYVEFMNLTDGLEEAGAGLIFGTRPDGKGESELWYENFGQGEFLGEFFAALYGDRYRPEDYVLFASDGMGGYYAFRKNDETGAVYYLDHEDDEVTTYPSFTDWLEETTRPATVPAGTPYEREQLRQEKMRTVLGAIFFVLGTVLLTVGICLNIGHVNKITALLIFPGVGAGAGGLATGLSSLIRLILLKKKLASSAAATEDPVLTRYRQAIPIDYGEIGTAKFLGEGLVFDAAGRYACKPGADGQGNEMAFYIEGTRLVSAPEGYGDAVDYESTLFRIEIGYFDGRPLSADENENGVRVSGLLEGTRLALRPGDGYNLSVETAETDEIDLGEIEFIKWDDEDKIIAFKCAATCGLRDVAAGKVRLTRDEIGE